MAWGRREKRRDPMKRPTLIVLLALLMVMAMVLAASPAFAGEMTGNGKPLWTSGEYSPLSHHTLHA